MGNQNKPLSETNKNVDQSFNKHPMFTDSKVIQDKEQNCYYQVSHSVATKNIYKNWMNAVEKFQLQVDNSQRFLLLPIESSYTQEGICGSAGILKIKFDYYPFTLAEQISNRNNLNQPFDQKEIWYLLFVLAQTSQQFHQRNMIVGDIQPENVFVNENGDVALFSLLAMPDVQSNYLKTFIHKEVTYLPPQGIIDTQNGKQTPTYNQQLGQSFSIGLTLLDATLLYSCRQLYNKALIFNQNRLKQLLKEFHNLGLSESLSTLIDGLLRVNSEERLSTKDVLQYLRQYEQIICNLEQFQPRPLPDKIQEKLKLKTNKKPASRVIHLSNSPHQTYNKNTAQKPFLQTTQFPIYIQNSNQRDLSVNFQKPQKIYSFMEPSQQILNVGRQISSTQFHNIGPISRQEVSNSRRNSNQNGMRESHVNRVIGTTQVHYSNNKYKHQENPIQNPSTSNSLASMKLKHVDSKNQREVYSNSNNVEIQYQKQNQEKLKSKFLNQYARESQNLLKQYQKRSYEQVKNNSSPSYRQGQKRNQYLPINMEQSYINKYDETKKPIQQYQQYSFGTGHISNNNLTHMGRITTSINPNNYPKNQQSFYPTKNQGENQGEMTRYNFKKYAKNEPGPTQATIYGASQNYPYNSYKMQDYPKQKTISTQINYLPSFVTSNQQQYSYSNNLNGNLKNTIVSSSQTSYGTGKYYVPTMPTTHTQNNSVGFKLPGDYPNKLYSKDQSGYSSNYSNLSNQYTDIFSAIDKQLQQSRKMYPGS